MHVFRLPPLYILDAWLSSLLAFTDYLITIFRYIGSLVNYINLSVTISEEGEIQKVVSKHFILLY